MRYHVLQSKIQKFAVFCNIFNRYVSSTSKTDYGQIYGCRTEKRQIRLYIKRKPRDIHNFADDFLQGYVAEDGSIYYRFQRTLPSTILTVIAPLFILGFGCILGGVVLKITPLLCLAPLALILGGCRLIVPKNAHQDLKDCLSRILDEANDRS